MRNQRINDDDHHTDEQCSCCGGWFDHHDTIQVSAAPPDVAHTGKRDDLELCEHCTEYVISDGFADTIRDSNAVPVVLPRVEFDALTEECKLNRIMEFIPANEQINSEEDVRDFFAALTRYLGWHPETDFADYEDQKTEKRLFDVAEAKELNKCMERSFEVCEKITKHEVDPYEIGMQEMAKHDEAMAGAMGRNHKTGLIIEAEHQPREEKAIVAKVTLDAAIADNRLTEACDIIRALLKYAQPQSLNSDELMVFTSTIGRASALLAITEREAQ